MRKHPEEAKTMNKQSKANVAQGEGANSEEDLEKEEERKKKGRIGWCVWFIAQELQEFLNVMKSRTTKKTWRNDEVTAASKITMKLW